VRGALEFRSAAIRGNGAPENQAAGGSFLQRKSGRELKKAAFYMEADRARSFKAWCALHQRDMSEVVDSLIAEHLARQADKEE
jgi:hypothetical protein